MESKVEFTACDFPQANRLTVHILAAVAEHERDMISQRTKEALAAAKARGVKLGNPNLATLNRDRGRRARAFTAKVGPTLEAYRQQGLSQRRMVEALNDCGVPAPRGGRWHAQTLTRVLKRLGQADGFLGEYKAEGISGAKGREQRPAQDAILKAAARREFDQAAVVDSTSKTVISKVRRVAPAVLAAPSLECRFRFGLACGHTGTGGAAWNSASP